MKYKYNELLKQKEWYNKCNIILNRDNYTCQDCGCRGFHNDTYYITDSIDEIDEIINGDILIGDTFSNLISQVKNGYVECDRLPESKNEQARNGYVRWETYENVDCLSFNRFDNGLYKYEIFLLNVDGLYFNEILELPPSPFLISENEYESLNFDLHKFRKSSSGIPYPMAILKFPETLSNHYILSINNDSISVTFENYVFYVNLSKDQFVYKGLNIHHKYYIQNHKPWEYDDSALVTLCEDCHQKRHQQQVPCYRAKDLRDIALYYSTCNRCGGRGYIPEYNHVQNGICFKCGGEGVCI